MNANEELIRRFYSAFQKLDYQSMNACYSDEVIFSDPAFGVLHGEEVGAMWEMLCKRAKDFSVDFSNIQLLDDEYATCDWVAKYTFSKTGRKIVNHVRAYMRIRNEKIIEHSDAFKLSKWLAQAFGWKGALLGWSGYMKKKVQNNARKNLSDFIQKRRSTIDY